MSNFAAIVGPLVISGSTKSDGTANAGGSVFAYLPDTLIQVSIYANADASTIVTQPIVLDNGGRIPRANYPDGLFITQPVRLLIQDSAGSTVSDSTYVSSTAGATGVNNEGFPSATTMDQVLTQLATSLGGEDGQFLESAGGTERTIHDKFSEIWVSVKDFGAVGNGIAIDTTACQSAINRVKALGGGVVYFPPGTYLIDQALTLTSANGVTFLGNGIGATTIKSSHATADMFTLTSCKSITFEGLECENTSASTGSVFAITTCTGLRFIACGSDGLNLSAPGGFYRYCMNLVSCSYVLMQDCRMLTKSTDASARVMLTSNCGTITVIGGFYLVGTASPYNWELTNSLTSLTSINVGQNGGAIRLAASLSTSPGITIVGGFGQIFSAAAATFPRIYLLNAYSIIASATSSAVGAAQTPSLIDGREVILSATSGGAGTVTVNAPATLPGTTSDNVDLYWDFVFINASGGAVTWSLNAVYVVNAAIPTTAAHTISVRFRWDRATSKLREVSRADTVT